MKSLREYIDLVTELDEEQIDEEVVEEEEELEEISDAAIEKVESLFNR